MDGCPTTESGLPACYGGAPPRGGFSMSDLIECGRVRRNGTVVIERKARQAAVQPVRECPRALAEQLQHRRQEDAADDECVEEHGAREAETELLDHAPTTENE